ncbi:Major Facilitator Superfamily protein [Streptomyces sp. YIM 121038]|uniref:MFS transporter n=1 Tax=Streptomyces sp. YIM 121038 TaxID=2136401 RepID=UPI001110DD42|nr:MFS transporter [Streptomyces sp. YIM 121038]QCX81729.1 Major Facilitator Superfamily protein [Streptomyces sp. YIM 121038]
MRARGTAALTLGVAVALIAGATLGNGGANLMPLFVDDFSSRFALGDSGAGLVGAAQLMATALVTLRLAARAARPGRVRMARTGLAVGLAGFVGATAASDLPTLILANLVIGGGLGAVYAAATAAIAATDDADKASAATIAGTVAVTALLIMAVPAANHSVGEGTGFLVMALCCLLAWPLVGGLPDGPTTNGAAQAGAATAGTAPAATPHDAATPSWVLLGGIALLWAVTQGAWAYASVFGREHTGMSPSAVSVVLAVSGVVALVGAVLGPAAARRFGRTRSLAAFITAQALSMAALVLTHDPVLFIVAAVLWQACQLAVLVQTLAAAALLDPSGRLVASLSGASALGTGIGPLAVGAVLDTAGAGVLGVVLALGTFVASLPPLRMTVASATADRAQPQPQPQPETEPEPDPAATTG